MIEQLPKNLDELDADALRALIRQSHAKQSEVMKIKELELSKIRTLTELKEQEILSKEQELSAARSVASLKDQELQNKEKELAKAKLEIQDKEQRITKLTHEIAVLRRIKFGKKSEQLQGEQFNLWQETVASDIAAIEDELKSLAPKKKAEPKQKPKRSPLPDTLPRIEIHNEPDNKTCSCDCQYERIGEDISEKLDYIPGVARVERHIRGKWVCRKFERHIRGKWVCRKCEVLVQEPVPAQVIDKGIATSGLLAHVLVAKYADHLPLYRQEQMFARAGIRIPSSTLADWVGVCGVRLQPLVDALREYVLEHNVLHADETPVTMLRPDTGKTVHKAYLWAYATTAYEDKPVVLYEFKPSRSGQNARTFLEGWHGKLVVDDYSGYKRGFIDQNITEIGCWAHARREFYELFEANGSPIAKQALEYIGHLYDVERQAKGLDKHERWQLRQSVAKPIVEKYHQWLQAQSLIATGPGIKKAINYSLKRWDTLVRYLDDGATPVDNNQVERQIRPIALGKKNWLFAGSLRGGERAAAVMTLIQSAKLNGHDPYVYMNDILNKLPTQPHSQIGELLPHNWRPETAK